MFGWSPKPSHIAVLDGDRAQDCARLHATGFPHPWDVLDFERLIGAETSFGHAAVETRDPRRTGSRMAWMIPRPPASLGSGVERGGAGEATQPCLGFILSRRAADEAEVLTIVVDPANRRQGLAGRLMAANMQSLSHYGVKSLFLEVGDTNVAARRLYDGLGFKEVGRRQGYYRTPGAPPATALILRRTLV